MDNGRMYHKGFVAGVLIVVAAVIGYMVVQVYMNGA